MDIISPSIQWFPGHMAKTRRMISANLKLVDVVVELRDSRIPLSSANPEIDRLVGNKPRVILLNKSDISDSALTGSWCAYYREKGIPVLAVDCRSGKGLKSLTALVEGALSQQLARRAAKGMSGRPVRMMIVGIPNVGKSSLINRMAPSKRAKVEDRPGVTRGKQWVKLEDGNELLDMPGVLWPKFEDQLVAENLAFTGAVKDEVLDIEGLATRLLERISREYPALLTARYKLTDLNLRGHDLLCQVAKNRGMLLPGGDLNTERGAIMVLDEFRGGKIGRITLEKPPAKQPPQKPARGEESH